MIFYLSIILGIVFVAALPFWQALHMQNIFGKNELEFFQILSIGKKRSFRIQIKSFVFYYSIFHSFVAFPLDLIARVMFGAENVAPFLYYPFVIVNFFFGPVVITISVLYAFILFWSSNNQEFCLFSHDALKIARWFLSSEAGSQYNPETVLLNGCLATLAYVLGASWDIIKYGYKAIIDHNLSDTIITNTAEFIRKTFAKDYWTTSVIGWAGMIPPVLISILFIACTIWT